ncbi:hypothetical protein GTU79_25615 [Sodalis ligni]|uniref:hypothetical protein n=1 Tax=Sodalis ligni TaxID=2697027 RepID=UPI00193F8F2E|nr:hypothetical protein [Sodalis ligni]QWA10537.1 hypothetical protein GTU79_25615 [Sodalis ligni]
MEHCHVNGTLSIIGTKTDKMPEASEHNLKIGAHSVINNIHVKNTEYNISSWVTSKFNTPNFIRNIFEMTAEYSRRTDQAESAIPLKSNVTLGANSVLKSITLDKDVSCTLVVPDDARFDGDPGVQGLTVINNGARAAA